MNKDPDVRIEALFVVGDNMPVQIAKENKKSMPYNWQNYYFFLRKFNDFSLGESLWSSFAQCEENKMLVYLLRLCFMSVWQTKASYSSLETGCHSRLAN